MDSLLRIDKFYGGFIGFADAMVNSDLADEHQWS